MSSDVTSLNCLWVVSSVKVSEPFGGSPSQAVRCLNYMKESFFVQRAGSLSCSYICTPGCFWQGDRVDLTHSVLSLAL